MEPIIITANDFGVQRQGSFVIFNEVIPRAITKEAALRMAAHLVANADPSPYDPKAPGDYHRHFIDILEAVESHA